ncbi:MAG: hypothetical protein IIY07_00625, partial [Thermoguttaceae bacterium]|nr:hypothetical protein [Thermoguttaceae bacterium]
VPQRARETADEDRLRVLRREQRLERDDADGSEEWRQGANVDLKAALSAESLKTEALRREFEETLASATASGTEKTERPERSEVSDVRETERRR